MNNGLIIISVFSVSEKKIMSLSKIFPNIHWDIAVCDTVDV